MGNVKKGISLVALIITIVVLIILTGSVIMTMTQGDIIGKSKEAVFKSDMANFKEELRNSILQAQLNGTISSKDDVNKTDWIEIKKYIPSATEKYNGSLSIAKGELIFSPNEELYNELYSAEIQIANTYGQVDNYEYALKDNYAFNNENTTSYLPAEVTSIAIPYGVKSIAVGTFQGCTNLKNIVIPNTVEIIKPEAFASCVSLTDIAIPNSVNTIRESAFIFCTNLTSITIPNNVDISESQVFYNCTNLTSITIPNGVTTIGAYAFYNCENLTSITISNNVTTIGEGAFYNCENLTNVTIDQTRAAATGIIGAFPVGCNIKYLR